MNHRPLAQYFKGRCKSSYDDNTTGFTEGVELMKGTKDGDTTNICIRDQEKNIWVDEEVRFFNCGGSSCCRFEFVNQPEE